MLSTSFKSCFRGLLVSAVSVAPYLFFPALTQAQLIPDDTLGAENSIVTPQQLRDLIEGGAIRGENLFHSFLEFNVNFGQQVYFANPEGISNILTRVTGGLPSNIDGVLGVDGAANLFLLNPNGINFGTNAFLDVSGSFFANTGSSFVFENGEEFSATNPQEAPLLTINITPGLQYGTPPQAPVTNQGNLQVGQDFNLSGSNLILQGQLLAGGNLNLQATDTIQIRDSVTAPFIAAAGGNLLVQGNQSVDIFALNHPDSGLFAGSDFVLRSGSQVGGDAHFWSGGSFRIERLDGSLGDLFSPYDPIIRALGDVSFNVYQGTSLHILAGGSVNIGTAIIVGSEVGEAGVDLIQETVTLSDGTEIFIDGSIQPTLDIRAGMAAEAIGTPSITGFADFPIDFFLDPTLSVLEPPPDTTVPATSAEINIGDVFLGVGDGLVYLTNQYQADDSLTEANITVTGTGFFGLGIISSPPDTSAGEIVIDSRGDINVNESAQVVDINGGDITLIAKSDISLFPGSIIGGDDITLTARGDIDLSPGSTISSRSLLGGNINLTSEGNMFVTNSLIGSISIEGSTIFSEITQAGDINITANSLSLTQGSVISTLASTNVQAGNINLKIADTLIIDGVENNAPTSILSILDQGFTGRSGDISIETNTMSITNGGLISSVTSGIGDAGNITIKAENTVSLEGVETIDVSVLGVALNSAPSSLQSVVNQGAVGNAGDIEIEAKSLTVQNGAQIGTSIAGRGQAGNININVIKDVTLSGATPTVVDNINFSIGSAIRTFILSEAFVEEEIIGKGGNISISASSLTMSDGGFIGSSTQAQGDAGNIFIQVEELISLSNSFINSGVNSGAFGEGGDINLQAQNLNLTQGAQITTGVARSSLGLPAAIGDGGDIHIDVEDTVNISGVTSDDLNFVNPFDTNETFELQGNPSSLFVSTERGATGKPGSITINTRNLNVSDRATIEASTGNNSNGGEIFVDAEFVNFTDGGQVLATTSSNGNAGTLSISATESILLRESSFSLEATADGKAGNLTLTTNQLTAQDNSNISVSALSGQAGNLEINANNLSLNQSQITALTALSDDEEGANINLQITNLLLLENESLISATALETANGGNLTINGELIVALPPIGANGSNIFANAFQGSGGEVTIDTQGLFGIEFRDFPTSLNDITASSEFGDAGIVTIIQPNVDPAQSITALPVDLIDATNLVELICPTGRSEEVAKFGSFVVTGKGGLPPHPGAILTYNEVLADFVSLENEQANNRNSQPSSQNSVPNQIIEAQGWYVGENGNIILTVEPNSQGNLLISNTCSGY